MISLLALAAAADPGLVDQRMLAITDLYQRACLTAFPDDKAVEKVMASLNARELTPVQVKVTMGDDPARAWLVPSVNATVWIEYPPFHACSVRWSASEIGNFDAYKAIVQQYEKTVGGFVPTNIKEADLGAIHIHATQDSRMLPDGSYESLMVVDQHISDPRRRALGGTGVTVRFVHQFAPPAPSK